MGNWKCERRDKLTFELISRGPAQTLTAVSLLDARKSAGIGHRALIGGAGGVQYPHRVPFVVVLDEDDLTTPMFVLVEGDGWSETIPLPQPA